MLIIILILIIFLFNKYLTSTLYKKKMGFNSLKIQEIETQFSLLYRIKRLIKQLAQSHLSSKGQKWNLNLYRLITYLHAFWLILI